MSNIQVLLLSIIKPFEPPAILVVVAVMVVSVVATTKPFDADPPVEAVIVITEPTATAV